MSRYKLRLNPQGIIPRDPSITISMQEATETTEPTEPTEPTCALGIAADSPVQTDTDSFLIIFTNGIQLVDLLITVTADEPPGSPGELSVAFEGAGSPPSYTETSVVVTIPAGSEYAVLRYRTGSFPAEITITATTADASCAAATATVSIICTTEIEDINYRIRTTLWTAYGDSIGGGNVVDNPTVTEVGTIEYRGNHDDILTTILDTDEVDVSASTTFLQIICEIVGDICDGDVITWHLSSGDVDLTYFTTYAWWAAGGASGHMQLKRVVIEAFGVPFGLSQAAQAPAFVVGQSFRITAKLNGSVIPLPRATFDVNFVV